MNEIYDSTASTLEHIKSVENNINIIINDIKKYRNKELISDINDMNIIDLLYILLYGQKLYTDNKMINSIYNNSINYLYNEDIMDQDELYKSYIEELFFRKDNHDKSKLEYPEKEYFDKYYKLKNKYEYGTKEYFDSLKKLDIALKHHYKNNRHHPEHFEHKMFSMNIMDVIEMLCDWKATADTQGKDAIYKGIEFNSERFSYDKKMVRVLSNTVDKYFRGNK